MAKKSMAQHAKDWKSPGERREMKREAAGNARERQVAKKEAKTAPPNTAKGKGGKDSGDSRGPGPEGFTKGMKKPKGGGC